MDKADPIIWFQHPLFNCKTFGVIRDPNLGSTSVKPDDHIATWSLWNIFQNTNSKLQLDLKTSSKLFTHLCEFSRHRCNFEVPSSSHWIRSSGGSSQQPFLVASCCFSVASEAFLLPRGSDTCFNPLLNSPHRFGSCVKKRLISISWRYHMNDAILHQDDILHGELTVKENLSFQAWKGNRSGLVLVNAVHMSTLFPKYSQKQLLQQPPELLIDALLMQTGFNANSSLQLLWHQR